MRGPLDRYGPILRGVWFKSMQNTRQNLRRVAGLGFRFKAVLSLTLPPGARPAPGLHDLSRRSAFRCPVVRPSVAHPFA